MSSNGDDRGGAVEFRRGDTVTVRSLDEILATLDADAKLDGLPFMPEMAPLCGKTFRVFRRAEKTCVEGFGIRRLKNAVFLDGLRCDGSAHGGCQRACLFFWNKAWLKAEEEGARGQGRGERGELSADASVELLDQQVSPPSALRPPPLVALPTTKGDRFYCQSTELAKATTEFLPGKLQDYLHDLRLGEITLRRFLYILWLAMSNRVWLLLHGRWFYQIIGRQTKTVSMELNLQPGELVEVRSPTEIKATLDAKGRNRGLVFEPEMALHCGRRYRVATPVRTIIAEETGKMVQLSNTVILDELVCRGICMKNCPRANYLYWREIWLKRVDDKG